MKIEKIKVEDLKPYKNNAKIHTEEQIEQIMHSIQQFGMNDPIGIWKDNTIIEGNGRLEACKKLGYKEVPCIRLDHLTDKERRAYALVHNKTTMNTDFDYDLLDSELDNLTDFDMSEFGFEMVDELDMDLDDKQSEYKENTGDGEVECPNCHFKFSPIIKNG